MKKILQLICCILLLTQVALGDEIKIGFECWPEQLQWKFAEYGLKVELSENKRENDSWAFIKNEGSRFIIYTYKPVTEEELEIIKKVIFEVMDARH